jgi:hypothetical protein
MIFTAISLVCCPIEVPLIHSSASVMGSFLTVVSMAIEGRSFLFAIDAN